MSRLSPSKEETWAQLQERLRRTREKRSTPRRDPKGADMGLESRRSVPPNPLPRLESPNQLDGIQLTSPELRGSYFPKVPPVTSHKASSDDTLSLNSYNSDSPSQEPLLTPPHATLPPYNSNGTAQPSQARPQVRVPVWDQYTGRRVGSELRDAHRRGKRKYHVRGASADFEGDIQEVIQANHLEIMAMHQDGYQEDDEGGYPEGGSRGEGPRPVEYDNLFGGREIVRMPAQRQETTVNGRMRDELFGRTFLEYFLTSCLQDDMVLEVALEVMAEAREEKDLERQLSWPVRDVGRELLEEVVHENLREIAFMELRVAVKGFWSTILDAPSLYKPIARDLLREVVDEEVTTLIPQCISDLVSEYFIQKDVVADYHVISDEVINSLLPDIILEVVYGESIDSLAEGIIQDEIVFVASCFMEDTFATGRPKIPMSPEQRLHDEDEVRHLADDFLLDVALFDSLLMSRLLPNNQVWNDEESLDLFMDSLLLDQVLGQQLEVAKRRDSTEDCLPLKRFHEKICTNVAIDVILDELSGHLDEDMAELDGYEVDMDQSVKQEPP